MLVGEGAKLDVHGCKTVDMASSFGKVCGPSPTPGPQSFPYRLSDSCRARLSAVDECGESTTVHGTAGAALQYSSPRAAGMLGYRRFWNSSSSFSHASPFSSVSMRPRARLPAGFSSRPHLSQESRPSLTSRWPLVAAGSLHRIAGSFSLPATWTGSSLPRSSSSTLASLPESAAGISWPFASLTVRTPFACHESLASYCP